MPRLLLAVRFGEVVVKPQLPIYAFLLSAGSSVIGCASHFENIDIPVDTSAQIERQEALPLQINQTLSDDGAVDVIVVMDPTEVQYQADVQKAVRGMALEDADITAQKALGYQALKQEVFAENPEIEVKREFTHLPSAVVRVYSSDALSALHADDRVLAIYPTETLYLNAESSLMMIGQPAVGDQGFTGAGTAVAILDTGIDYTNRAFGACVEPGSDGCHVAVSLDFAPSDNRLDDHGHGTNVGGIVLEVAPQTTLLSLDVFKRDAKTNAIVASSEDILAAIDWVIANKFKYNIVALNLSLGDSSQNSRRCSSSWATSLFRESRSAGIIPVVAAGNYGYSSGLANPACAPGAVSVGAVYTSTSSSYSGSCTDTSAYQGKVACFSNSASYLNFLAPGSAIEAAGIMMSGTSQASPHIAGAIAVLRAAPQFADLTVDQILERLTSTGTLVRDPRSQQPVPLLNLDAAINSDQALITSYAFAISAKSGKASSSFVSSDGRVDNTAAKYDWTGGWDTAKTFEMVGQNYLFLLKRSSGTLHIHQLLNNGSVGPKSEVKDWPSGIRDVAFATVDAATLVLALKVSTGQLFIHRLQSDGSLGAKTASYNWAKGWTSVATYSAGQESFVLLLNKSNGKVHIYPITAAGKLGPLRQKYDWTSGWSVVEPFVSNDLPFLFLLKSSNGKMHIQRINEDGSIGERVQTADWSKGWNAASFFISHGQTHVALQKTRKKTLHIYTMNQNGTVGERTNTLSWPYHNFSVFDVQDTL